MARACRVLVDLNLDEAFERDILGGIALYAQNQPDWTFAVVPWREVTPAELRSPLPQDAIVGRLNTSPVVRSILRRRIPAVNISTTSVSDELPQVAPDNRGAGRLAAEHFLARGFRHFAYRGDRKILQSVERFEGFSSRLAEDGMGCIEMVGSPSLSRRWDWAREMADTAKWLEKLPGPTGMLTFNSVVGRRVLEACRQNGVRVPEDVAVVGGMNDELICELSRPRLSGVEVGAERIGFEVARTLERIVRGKKAKRVTRVPPLHVVTRQSSDILAVSDEDVSLALRFIQDHACEGVRVGDVLDHVAVSRRALEKKFSRILGRTPAREIARVRVEKAKQLLADTDWTVSRIARESGFRDPIRFSEGFRRAVGMPPSGYRRRIREGRDAMFS